MDGQTGVRLILIVIVALVLVVLVTYYNRNKSQLESERFRADVGAKEESISPLPAYAPLMPNSSREPISKKSFGKQEVGKFIPNQAAGGYAPAEFEKATSAGRTGAAGGASQSGGEVAPFEALDTEQNLPVDPASSAPAAVRDAYPGAERLKVEDLLPKDAANSAWAQVNPAGQGDVADHTLLNAGALTGINTKGNSLRNANLQLRSDPPNPKLNVGIWNMSTIEADTSRRPFEVGGY